MDTTRPTPTIEDYLGVIYILQRDGEPAFGARLAELLEVSPPTVTVTVKRMVRDGWVTINGKKEILLTERGIVAARSVTRRHILSELLLSNVLKVPWSKVHEEAHRLEHTFSEETEERLLEEFGEQQVCPHGNPLPKHEMILKDYIPLGEIPIGTSVIIRRIHEHAEDRLDLLRFLEDNRILPGRKALVTQVSQQDQSISLTVEGRSLSLDIETANIIYVDRLDK